MAQLYVGPSMVKWPSMAERVVVRSGAGVTDCVFRRWWLCQLPLRSRSTTSPTVVSRSRKSSRSRCRDGERESQGEIEGECGGHLSCLLGLSQDPMVRVGGWGGGVALVNDTDMKREALMGRIWSITLTGVRPACPKRLTVRVGGGS